MRSGFDPWSPQFVAHPYDAYAELREHQPVSWFEPTGQWLVSRHDDVNALLRDRRLGRTYLHVATHEEMGRPAGPGPPRAVLARHPQRHARPGAARPHPAAPAGVAGVHARGGSRRCARRSQRIADGLVDDFVADGGGDLIARVAEPLPVTVIAEMLGVPGADRPPAAAVVGRHLRDVRAEPVAGGRRPGRARRASSSPTYLRGLARARAGRAPRRPDHARLGARRRV